MDLVSFDGFICQRAVPARIGIRQARLRHIISSLNCREPRRTDGVSSGGMEVFNKGLHGRQVIGAEGVQGRFGRHVGRTFWIGREVDGVRSERDTPELGVCCLSPSCQKRFIIFVTNHNHFFCEKDFAIFVTKDSET